MISYKVLNLSVMMTLK